MAIDKVITIQSSEQKSGKKEGNIYLEVIDHESERFSCWEQELWNDLGTNATVKISYEKKGIFKNIIAVELVKEGIDKIAPTPKEFHEPQEIGMWCKELGEFIRSGQLEKDFPKSYVRIKSEYYKRMSDAIDIDFWKGEG